MATGCYLGVNGSPKEVKEIYIGTSSGVKKVKEGYIGVGGVPKLFYVSQNQLLTPIATFEWDYLPGYLCPNLNIDSGANKVFVIGGYLSQVNCMIDTNTFTGTAVKDYPTSSENDQIKFQIANTQEMVIASGGVPRNGGRSSARVRGWHIGTGSQITLDDMEDGRSSGIGVYGYRYGAIFLLGVRQSSNSSYTGNNYLDYYDDNGTKLGYEVSDQISRYDSNSKFQYASNIFPLNSTELKDDSLEMHTIIGASLLINSHFYIDNQMLLNKLRCETLNYQSAMASNLKLGVYFGGRNGSNSYLNTYEIIDMSTLVSTTVGELEYWMSRQIGFSSKPKAYFYSGSYRTTSSRNGTTYDNTNIYSFDQNGVMKVEGEVTVNLVDHDDSRESDCSYYVGTENAFGAAKSSSTIIEFFKLN